MVALHKLSGDILSLTLISAFISIICCFLASHLAKRFSGQDKRERHWIHDSHIPRVGGISIAATFLGISFFLDEPVQALGVKLFISASPILLCGICEDFGFRTKPRVRIVAGFLASALAISLFDANLTRTEIFFLDPLLNIPVIAIALTLFASTTLAHAYNLVDGLNGLSSGLGMLALLLFSAIAYQKGDTTISHTCLVIAACIVGFWLINIATERIFLGDAGAYSIGHIIAWFSILLVSEHPTISPWALILGTIYPITEILTTIARRKFAGFSFVTPDQEHLHHMAKDYISNKLKLSNFKSNSLSSLLLQASAVCAMVLAYKFSQNSIMCATLALLFFIGWVFAYIRLRKANRGR